MKIPIDQVNDTSETQCRHAMSAPTVQWYAECIQDGDELPPLKCVFEESTGTYYLIDGYHTLGAFRLLKIREVDVEVVQSGTLEDAKWLAAAQNKDHGLTRTIADKNMAVQRALAHPFSKGKTSREIAEWVGVSHTFVNDVKKKIEEAKEPQKDKVKESAIESIEDKFPKEADALRDGSLNIPEKELVEFAARSDDEQEKLAPYLFGNRMSLKQAEQVVQYRPANEALPLRDYLDYVARNPNDGTFYFREHTMRLDVVTTGEGIP